MPRATTEEDTASTPPARPIPVPSAAPPTSSSNTLLILVVIVATLYVGRTVLVPFALAILLTFILAPIVKRLERWGVGRVPSVVAVTALVVLVLAGFGAVVGSQVASLADDLPTYENNIRAKIRSIQASAAGAKGGFVREASDMVRDLRADLEQATGAAQKPDPAAASAPRESQPVPVTVQEPDPRPWDVVWGFLGTVLAPFGTAGMVLVLTIFMLLQRADLRDRLIRLAGSGDLSSTTDALNDAGERVSRYLLMQVVVNVLYGLPIGIGLALLGVPSPVLWGLLATVLRFIPFAGPVIAAIFPILLSFAIAPGWALPLFTIGLFVAIELFSNNVVEPWLYGSATGLSPVAIIVAAVFWTTLWGPAGLLLATPLTVCLVVLGRHVPHLRFFEVMFGDRPVLPDDVKVYQRMLAHDPDEALEVCERVLEKRSMPELFDTVLLPALSLAERERQRGTLDAERQRTVADSLSELLDSLSEMEGAEKDETVTRRAAADGSILCVGARNDLDEAAACLLADLLRRRGRAATVVPCEAVGPRAITSLARDGVRAVVLSSLNPSALPHARRLVRRLRQRVGPGVPVVLALWSPPAGAAAPPPSATETVTATGADRVVGDVSTALAHLQDLGLLGEADSGAAPAPAST